VGPRIREVLKDRNLTEATVRHFIEKVVEREAETYNGDRGYLEVMRHALDTFYPSAVSKIYAAAGSPIEALFLNALLLSFLFADPIGLIFTGPHEDVLCSLERYRKPRRRMLDVDREMNNPPGDPNGFLIRLRELRDNNQVSAAEYEQYRNEYLFDHGLGFWHAFCATPQAGFPDLRLDGHSLRADLFVCVPGDETFKLVVECDGFQFHSDKEAFTRDRRRDRLLKSNGIDTLRFSGPEIYRDPAKAGIELFDYLQGLKKDRAGGA